jgi:nicotinate-nucleotide pyrophosphorylase (carboxylating)
MCPPFATPAPATWLPLLESALEEDIGPGDLTGELLIPAPARGRARIEARQTLRVCGLEIAAAVFEHLDPELRVSVLHRDGETVPPGSDLLRVEGALRPILAGERLALNFLGRLCGVATFTHHFTDAIKGTGVTLADTRKTIPGWRHLDKYATAVGGAVNQRIGLYDAILIKENHIEACGGVKAAFEAARSRADAEISIQVEVRHEGEAREALDAGADFLLLDNWSTADLARVVPQLRHRARLEASGGIHLGNVRAYAETGVDRISIGALTHSAPAADVALEIAKESP